ncbi:hypothetical protein VPH35_081504 [Triticum aestivum]
MPRMGDPETRPAEGVEFFDVIPHYPEDFFVTFRHQHHRDTVNAAPGKFVVGELDIRVSNWSPRAHADAVELRHHVHLFLENVPLNAWNEEVVAKLLEGAAVPHYFDAATTQKADASSLNLWAWTANPSSIPKVMWLTIIGGCASGDNIVVSSSGPLPGFSTVASSSSATQQGRKGLTYRVIIHLDIHKDFTQGASTSRFQHRFDWQYGVVDGEAAVRDRGQPVVEAGCNDDNDRRCRDDDDERRRRDRGGGDDRRGRNSERQRSWGDRFFRSRSRAGGERGERRDDRLQEDRRDRRCEGQAMVADGGVMPTGDHAERTPLAQLRRDRTGALVWRRIPQPLGDMAPPDRAAPSRGRNLLCSRSPGLDRRRSRDSLTPPGSPSSVLPAASNSKDRHAVSVGALSTHLQEALLICSPDRLVPPLRLLSLPPGLQSSPASPLISEGTPICSPHVENEGQSQPDGLQHLFQPLQGGLLEAPAPSPRRMLANRHKTLAGVSIGYTLRRSSARLRAAGRARAAPVEATAQKIVCRGLGIVQDGEDITEAAISALELKFKDQLSDEVIGALRQIFQLDDASAVAAEEALLARGGSAALDIDEEQLVTNA